jgi:hypothetical protein
MGKCCEAALFCKVSQKTSAGRGEFNYDVRAFVSVIMFAQRKDSKSLEASGVLTSRFRSVTKQ